MPKRSGDNYQSRTGFTGQEPAFARLSLFDILLDAMIHAWYGWRGSLTEPSPWQGGGKAVRSAFGRGPATRGRPVYVSAKRTHFVFDQFVMDHYYPEILMPFAAAFANGFVYEKRTHF